MVFVSSHALRSLAYYVANGEKGKKILVSIQTTKPLKITGELKDSSTLELQRIKYVPGSQWSCTGSYFGLAFPH